MPSYVGFGGFMTEKEEECRDGLDLSLRNSKENILPRTEPAGGPWRHTGLRAGGSEWRQSATISTLGKHSPGDPCEHHSVWANGVWGRSSSGRGGAPLPEISLEGFGHATILMSSCVWENSPCNTSEFVSRPEQKISSRVLSVPRTRPRKWSEHKGQNTPVEDRDPLSTERGLTCEIELARRSSALRIVGSPSGELFRVEFAQALENLKVCGSVAPHFRFKILGKVPMILPQDQQCQRSSCPNLSLLSTFLP